MKLTIEQKIEILEKAKDYLKVDHQGICIAIEESSDSIIEWDCVFVFFPELLKYKPKKPYYFGIAGLWWKQDNYKKRIQVIDKTISDLKSQLNK